MIKLFYVPRTRATRPRWILEEAGAPYELIRVDPAAPRTEEHLSVQPLGKVPGLIDGEIRMFESAAICTWLADRFPHAGLAPAHGTPDRAHYYQWIHFGMSTLEVPVSDVASHRRFLPAELRSQGLEERARGSVSRALQVIEPVLAEREYLLGRFTTADVVAGSVAIWAQSMQLVGDSPSVVAWIDRLKARPAWQRSVAD